MSTVGAAVPAGVEIERKFIVDDVPAALAQVPGERVSQGYLAIGENGFEVRVRRRGAAMTLTIKNGTGLQRQEEEIVIEPETFAHLWRITEGRRVEKVRRVIPVGDGHRIELDTYADGLTGLITAEVEFNSEQDAEAFEPPDWFGPEVTEDPRYKNQRLACFGAPRPPREQPERFRIRHDETLPDGIRRILRGQIDLAIDDLAAGARADPAEAVHECRKSFKRVRAALRLIRDEIGDEAYRRENATFRDLGRRLSGARDSQVLVETLDALGRDEFSAFRAQLVAEQHAAEREVRGQAQGALAVIAELRDSRMRIAAWEFRDDDPAALAPAFGRIYRRGRRALRAVRDDPSDEHFHELRKRTKDLWHAAQILRATAPKSLNAIARRAHHLADLVGDDHDLVVLAQQARRRPDAFADAHELERLEELIARRRRTLQHDAVHVAEKLYAEKPGAMARLALSRAGGPGCRRR